MSPAAEAKARYYSRVETRAMAAQLNQTNLRQTRRGPSGCLDVARGSHLAQREWILRQMPGQMNAFESRSISQTYLNRTGRLHLVLHL